MSEQTPQSREKVKPHRFADGGSDTWWGILLREKAAGKIHWRFSRSEIFGYRLFLGVLVVILAMFGWYFWQPRLTGVFPIKKSKFVEQRRTTLPKTGGRRGETLNTEVTVPAHYAATVEIEGIPVTVWVDEDDEEYLADGKLTIHYLRRKNGVQILSVRD